MKRTGLTLLIVGFGIIAVSLSRWIIFRFFELPQMPPDPNASEGSPAAINQFEQLVRAALIATPVVIVGAFLYDRATRKH